MVVWAICHLECEECSSRAMRGECGVTWWDCDQWGPSVARGELWSSFVQYLCKYGPHHSHSAGSINYTNNYSTGKLTLDIITFLALSSHMIYTNLRHFSMLSSTPPPPPAPAGWAWPCPCGEQISDPRWAIWSLSEDWCEVLGKFKIISPPRASVIMKY